MPQNSFVRSQSVHSGDFDAASGQPTTNPLRLGTRTVSFSDDIEPYVTAGVKLFAVWGMTLYGVLTLHNIALLCGITYSGLQIYVLWRDKIRKK